MTEGEGPDAARFEALVAALGELDPDLSPVAAAALVACHANIARDSRSFANRLGIAHAVVLREVNGLVEGCGLLVALRRDPRTLRLFYELSPEGLQLLERARPKDS